MPIDTQRVQFLCFRVTTVVYLKTTIRTLNTESKDFLGWTTSTTNSIGIQHSNLNFHQSMNSFIKSPCSKSQAHLEMRLWGTVDGDEGDSSVGGGRFPCWSSSVMVPPVVASDRGGEGWEVRRWFLLLSAPCFGLLLGSSDFIQTIIAWRYF